MSQEPKVISESKAPAPSAVLEGGAYEVIRARLDKHSADLRSRLSQLNTDRQAVFGAIEPALVATERVTTSNNCTPRDMIAIGRNRFIFGYNVQLGLRSTTELADVFSIYQFDPKTHTLSEIGPADIIDGGDFPVDFSYLYKYYKETIFVKFKVIGPHLFAAFRVGKGVDDIKTFKFLLGEGTLTYLGNRFDHEYIFPPQQEFEWKRAHRDMHRSGVHPHISIDDRVFVEAVGGDLTIKIEDNTESGQGIYDEPVDNPDQTLDDAEILYATIGSLILLKIRPYQEKNFRYLVYNEKIQSVRRIDSIEHSCVLLPDDHGIIFSNGYHLQTGETKIFDIDLKNMLFDRRIAASNGEDFLYVFYNRLSGDYILMSYNLIAQQVDTPIICHGYSLFPNGELIYFRTENQPQKHHALQIWQTPITAETLAPATDQQNSLLFKIGNADIVRCMAECHEVLNLLSKDDSYADLYIDLVKKTSDLTDSYFWIGKEETQNLKAALTQIHSAAAAAIDEFDKVQRLRAIARSQVDAAKDRVRKSVSAAEHTRPDDIMGFVQRLAELRAVRGEVISLNDVRYVDTELIESLESDVTAATEKVSTHCVEFLLKPEALDPYRKQVAEQRTLIKNVAKVADANLIEEALLKAGTELEMLIDIVSNLKIEDATQTTQIIDDVSAIYAALNQVRVELKNRKKDLARVEGVAQFGAQVKLLDQAVINYLDLCTASEKCEEYLTKIMIQLEELEGKFSEFDEYVEQLGTKREEVYDAFESRKQSLLETRNKRTTTLSKSAERILNGIRHRVGKFETINEINGYLAGDLMIDKVRNLITELTELGDSVKADGIQTELKTIREDAVRQLKDRQELFVDGQDIIKFGKHKFSVNTQELELSIVQKDDDMFYHLTGTNFFEKIKNEEFLATKNVWAQSLISEDQNVYRAEYLAYQFLKSSSGSLPEPESPENNATGAADSKTGTHARLKETLHTFMGPRYAEGYTKGVHDQDALKILEALIPIHQNIGLLAYDPGTRARALLFWHTEGQNHTDLAQKIAAHTAAQTAFKSAQTPSPYIEELATAIATFPQITDPTQSAQYLAAELAQPTFTPILSQQAHDLLTNFKTQLTTTRQTKTFEQTLTALPENKIAQWQITRDWLAASAWHDRPGHVLNNSQSDKNPKRPQSSRNSGSLPEPNGPAQSHTQSTIEEAAAHLTLTGFPTKPNQLPKPTTTQTTATIQNLLGTHDATITPEKTYYLDYLSFTQKLRTFTAESVPRFQSFQTLKTKLADQKRESMRLSEFKPRVMSSFVRNQLLNDVYLPLIGDNLAKQMGTVGSDTRTDRMGMLLLISPPGYGKTTLMEYVANRLGITFMKISGPAIGHAVTSLDPAEAPNMSAREEVEKLNLAFEMGDNVMIYLDDIQHCNPELLQKFISLCDGQRKIEGVYQGKARTYDLRGKKVAVVMAGNPYTESGGKFQIPDMLANRADTYNLGDIIGGHAEVFKASYIENSLTSNPVLSKLSSRSQKDVHAVMQLAKEAVASGVPPTNQTQPDFEANYSVEEINELVSVTQKLFRVRDTILRVNLEYIKSAAQQDDYRTEPPFKLQGSYRNMNRIAEKILPLMTDEEVEAIIIDHYENESQTLTTGAESNLLKFRQMENLLTEEESQRWQEIKKTFRRNLLMGGTGENDPVSRVVGALGAFSKGLDEIRETIAQSAQTHAQPKTLADHTITQLEKIITGLRAVPVDVEIKVMPVQEDSTHDLPVDVASKVKQKP